MGDSTGTLNRIGSRLHLTSLVALGLFVVSVVLTVPAVLEPWRDLVLGNLVFLLPAGVLVVRACLEGRDGWWAWSLAAGVLSFFGGNVYYLWRSSRGEVPFPSWADLGYLGIYPFLVAAVLLGLARLERGTGRAVLLDGLVGALGTGAVASLALSPLLHPTGGPLAAAVSVGYPIGDLLVVSAALGALGVLGLRRAGLFLGLAGGFVVFAVADVTYAYRLALGTYEVGTWLDALWAIGVGVIASTAWRMDPPTTVRVPGVTSLAVSVLAASAAVIVLVTAPLLDGGPSPVALAAVTLVGCAVRMVLAFAQLRQLSSLQTQAMTDELTGVANRRALYQHLDRLLDSGHGAEASPPGRSPRVALAIVDLDRFKEVNDSFGHAAGDQLLRTVSGRFTRALERQPWPFLLARLGGDEFAVVLHDVSRAEDLIAVATSLHETLHERVPVDGTSLHVQASVGLASAPAHARTRGDLMFAADVAMYSAKATGEPICLYSPAAAGDRRERLTLAEELYDALERNQLTVEYQPIVRDDDTVVLAEALVRWDHPVRGRLDPPAFLHIAERNRLTSAITARVLGLALSDVARWSAQGWRVGCSVNISATDLRDEHIVALVAEALLAHAVPPELLTLEITETALMRNPAQARRVLNELHQLGVLLAIDDYGTGYSSLEYLLQLPIQMLKLDRAFSVTVSDDRRAGEIVRSTVQLAHALGLQLVAEGVENQATVDRLGQLGCDLMQGWHLGVPVSAAEFEAVHLSVRSESQGVPRHE